MIKISQSKKTLSQIDAKFVRLEVTEDAQDTHRFVEATDGTLTYKMGAGKCAQMTPRKFITFVRAIVQAAQSHQVEYLAIELQSSHFPKLVEQGPSWFYSTLVENILIASYSFTKYKSTDSKRKALKEVMLCGALSPEEQNGFDRGYTVATYVNLARDTANTTASDMTPTHLGNMAKNAVKGTKATVTVLGEKELQKLKMGLLLAVGQGTKHETKLIVVEYWGLQKPKASVQIKKELQPIIFVGKGITYDTGGLNVKPSGGMHDMHMDMSGGSSVIAAVACAAKMGLKKNIIGIVPAAENAISDSAMRAGDIVTAMNGTTVEILHTDAEGRMVLADALTYAQKYNPKVVLDVATLTGASLVALGQHASAVMTKDEELEKTLKVFGERSGDYVWPLPLWDEYKQYIKSTRADISNIATNFSRNGGTIEGGTFLSFFAPKCPWAHIDIAPRMDTITSDKLAKGSTGEPVRLLVTFAEEY